MTKPRPKWWFSYWIAIVVATIIIGVTLPILRNIPWDRAVLYLAATLAIEALAYYARLKPSMTLNRIMYILIGFPLGFVLWFIAIFTVERTFYPQAANDVLVFVGSMIICIGIGCLVGDFIGRLRHYKGPEQYQP